jgi:hypothetical protein
MQLLELEEYQQNKNSPQRVGWFFKEASLKPAKAVQ